MEEIEAVGLVMCGLLLYTALKRMGPEGNRAVSLSFLFLLVSVGNVAGVIRYRNTSTSFS
jgi:hypothetical protein